MRLYKMVSAQQISSLRVVDDSSTDLGASRHIDCTVFVRSLVHVATYSKDQFQMVTFLSL